MRAPVASLFSWAFLGLCAPIAGGALTVTGVDQEREAAPPPPPRGAAGAFQLTRREAEVLFIVDRSGSMSTVIATTATGYTSRWEALYSALAATLPRYEQSLTLGLFIFPSTTDSCGVRSDGDVDVPPARSSASRVFRELRRFGPSGRTPTGAAVLYGARYLLPRAATNVSRTIVLATDGAPTCTVGGGDEVSDAIAAIAMARAQGVSTHVIGISAPGRPSSRWPSTAWLSPAAIPSRGPCATTPSTTPPPSRGRLRPSRAASRSAPGTRPSAPRWRAS